MELSDNGVEKSPSETTSTLIRRILAELPGEDVRIGYIVYKLRRRSFGGLLILLAALSLLPGISIFAGIAMILPGVQMLLGFRAPLLPWIIRKQTIKSQQLQAIGARAIAIIYRVEQWVKPRWPVLTAPPVPNLIGVLVIGLAIVVMLPLPLSNLPPAIALLLLSLGLLERDGVVVVIGLFAAVIALTIGGFITYFGFESVQFVLQKYFA